MHPESHDTDRDSTPLVNGYREHAWGLFAGQTDKDYDLIDCISFATMEALSVDQAFSFDRHFAQYGLSLHP